MTTLRRSRRTPSALFCDNPSLAETVDRHYLKDPDPAGYSRFKVQLKRAVDSTDAPEYLIHAIRAAIRK